MNSFNFNVALDPLIELFKSAKEKPETKDQVPTTQGVIPGVQDPSGAAFKDFMARMPAAPSGISFDSGQAADAASTMQSTLGSAGIQNTAASMLQPGAALMQASIPGRLDLTGMPGSEPEPESNPVQDEIDRAEGEWKDTGLLEDDDEGKAKPKTPTLLMETSN